MTASGTGTSLGIALFLCILAEDHAWEVLQYIVDTCDVAAVHLAPPCGTCSKARGMPMPDGTPGPPPLRSLDFLLGVPDMSPGDRVKVEAANRLYERMGQSEEYSHDATVLQ